MNFVISQKMERMLNDIFLVDVAKFAREDLYIRLNFKIFIAKIRKKF